MRMILQIIISNGILDLVTGILAKISLGTGIWYPPSQPSLFFQQLSYLMYDVHAKTAPKSLLDKFGKINTKHHYNTRLSAKECFSVKFSRTEKNEKIFY